MTGFSVLTNPQAASALLNLNRTLQDLNITQERINTGLKVGKARHDAATYSIALGMQSDLAGFRAISDNLLLGQSTLGVASSAASSISEELKTIKEKVVQASNNSAGRDLIQVSIDNAIQQIRSITAAAQFNGVNLIDGDQDNAGEFFTVVSSLDRNATGDLSLGTVEVGYEDLSIEEKDRGLGSILGLDVREGKATEQTVVNDSPTYVQVDVSGITSGEAFTFNYTNADGEAEALTFTASSAGASLPFTFDGGGTAIAITNSLISAFTQLSANGGPLENLGFAFSADAAGVFRITRDVGDTPGKITGIKVDDTNANVTQGDVTLLEARENINSQIGLTFNRPLEAGDEIVLKMFDGAAERTVTFRVGEKGDTSFTSGSALAGTTNTFGLRYEDVVQTTGGVDRSPAEVATFVSSLLNTTAGASGEAGAAFSGFFNTGLGTDYSVQVVDDEVIVTDLLQAVTDSNQAFVSFNLGDSPQGDLDFDELLLRVEAAENHLKNSVGRLGAAEQRIDSQSSFIDTLIKSIREGIGTLVDADMAEESARLQSLQVQQQLGIQALSIANAQPQSILSLFN